MMSKQMTVEQAYRAMFYFLERECELTKSDELGGMLGSLSWAITGGNGPADPAAWPDWLEAVQRAIESDENAAPPA